MTIQDAIDTTLFLPLDASHKEPVEHVWSGVHADDVRHSEPKPASMAPELGPFDEIEGKPATLFVPFIGCQ